MSAAQLLLRRLLDQAGGATETGYVLVIDGEGLENLPDQMPTPKGSYGVHRISTELGLRHLLWKAKGAPLIAVMPEDVARRIQKAPDLLRRARNQRVHALSVNDVLEVVLGVRVVGADAPYMQQLALENVDRLGRGDEPSNASDRRRPQAADRASGRRQRWRTGADAEPGSAARRVGAGAAAVVSEHQPARARCHADAPRRRGAPAFLGACRTGSPAARARRPWRRAHGRGAGASEARVGTAVEGGDRAADRNGPANPATDGRPPRRGDAVGARRRGWHTALGADRIGRECLTPTQLQTSRVLPLAFSDRCHSLAQQAAAGKPISAADIAWLAGASRRSDAPRRPGGARGRWRASRAISISHSARRPICSIRSATTSAAARSPISRCFSFAARSPAASTTTLRRTRCSRRAASGATERTGISPRRLASGYEAALHREGLTPLHRIWKRTVAPLWQSEPDARLFLVVLDGCSYPVFLELLHALSQDNSFPLGMKPDADGRVVGTSRALAAADGHEPCSRRHLPRRAAERSARRRDGVPRSGRSEDRQGSIQPERCARRPKSSSLPEGDLADGGQACSPRSRTSRSPWSAAVFNAVDDQIGSVEYRGDGAPRARGHHRVQAGAARGAEGRPQGARHRGPRAQPVR